MHGNSAKNIPLIEAQLWKQSKIILKMIGFNTEMEIGRSLQAERHVAKRKKRNVIKTRGGEEVEVDEEGQTATDPKEGEDAVVETGRQVVTTIIIVAVAVAAGG
mmetsp:Transcript_2544/g.5015  ORF Transcript_2544/g.5015 Transcript_2544/m.5015 type:complete len:104 (-) Transcript_2544:2761-3072(-)